MNDDKLIRLAFEVIGSVYVRRAVAVASDTFRVFQGGKDVAPIAFLPPDRADVQTALIALEQAYDEGIGDALRIVNPHIDTINADTAKGATRKQLDVLNDIYDRLHKAKHSSVALADARKP